jgi:hypothetical protein
MKMDYTSLAVLPGLNNNRNAGAEIEVVIEQTLTQQGAI